MKHEKYPLVMGGQGRSENEIMFSANVVGVSLLAFLLIIMYAIFFA